MTTKRADKLIQRGTSVTLYNPTHDERFRAVIIRRDRYNLYTEDGGVYDRAELVEGEPK